MDCPKRMWSPRLEPTRMSAFMDHVNAKYTLRLGGREYIDSYYSRLCIYFSFGFAIDNYQDLWKWSVVDYAAFWEEFFYFSGIKYSQPHNEVLQL